MFAVLETNCTAAGICRLTLGRGGLRRDPHPSYRRIQGNAGGTYKAKIRNKNPFNYIDQKKVLKYQFSVKKILQKKSSKFCDLMRIMLNSFQYLLQTEENIVKFLIFENSFMEKKNQSLDPN